MAITIDPSRSRNVLDPFTRPGRFKEGTQMCNDTIGGMTKKAHRTAPDPWLRVIDHTERVCLRGFEAVEHVAFRAALLGCFLYEVYRLLIIR